MPAYSTNSQQNFNMLVQDISYLKSSQVFSHKLANCRLYLAIGQYKQNAAVERTSEVLTRQFCSLHCALWHSNVILILLHMCNSENYHKNPGKNWSGQTEPAKLLATAMTLWYHKQKFE